MSNPDPFKGNFLKNLPSALNSQQRIALESIDFSIDAIHLSYIRIIENLTLFQSSEVIENMPELKKSSLFIDIWNLIDHAHAIIQLLYQSSKKGKKPYDFSIDLKGSNVANFIEEYYQKYSRVITSARNYRDHLSGNFENIIETKKLGVPIHGSLSYLLTNDIKASLYQKERNVVILASGPFIKGKHSFPALNPCDLQGKSISSPVDHLHFFTLDRGGRLLKIETTELYHDTMRLKQLINTEMAEIFEKFLRKYAGTHRIASEDIFQTLPGEFYTLICGRLASEEEVKNLIENQNKI